MASIYLLKLLPFHSIYYYENNYIHIVLIQAGPDAQFYVKYRIRETTCAIEENKLWQDCEYKVPAEAVSICPLEKFSAEMSAEQPRLGKNTVENLTCLSVLLLTSYRTKIQYRNIYNSEVNCHNCEFTIITLNRSRREHFSPPI